MRTGARNVVVRKAIEVSPYVGYLLTYESDVSSGMSENEAVADAFSRTIGTYLGGSVGLYICSTPASPAMCVTATTSLSTAGDYTFGKLGEAGFKFGGWLGLTRFR